MSKESILSKSQTDWQRIDRMDDGDIDLSDCPEVTEQMFALGCGETASIEKSRGDVNDRS